MRCVVSVALILVLVSNAFAAEPATEETKVHVRKATADYNLGKYVEAAKEYEAAYELTLDSNLLFNVAQAYRLAGEREKAITTYRSFIRSAPKSEQRGLAETKVRELEEQRSSTPASTPAAAGVTATPPVPTGVSPAAPQVPRAVAARAVEAPAGGPAPGSAAQVDRSSSLLSAPAQEPQQPQQASPFYKRWPFWTAVGVAVAGGVTLGIVLSGRGHDLTMPSNTKEF